MKKILFILFCIFLFSCQKEETPIDISYEQFSPYEFNEKGFLIIGFKMNKNHEIVKMENFPIYLNNRTIPKQSLIKKQRDIEESFYTIRRLIEYMPDERKIINDNEEFGFKKYPNELRLNNGETIKVPNYKLIKVFYEKQVDPNVVLYIYWMKDIQKYGKANIMLMIKYTQEDLISRGIFD